MKYICGKCDNATNHKKLAWSLTASVQNVTKYWSNKMQFSIATNYMLSNIGNCMFGTEKSRRIVP